MREDSQFWVLVVEISLYTWGYITYLEYLADDIVALKCSFPRFTSVATTNFFQELQLFKLNVAMSGKSSISGTSLCT